MEKFNFVKLLDMVPKIKINRTESKSFTTELERTPKFIMTSNSTIINSDVKTEMEQIREILKTFSEYCNSFNIENNCIDDDDIDNFLKDQYGYRG